MFKWSTIAECPALDVYRASAALVPARDSARMKLLLSLMSPKSTTRALVEKAEVGMRTTGACTSTESFTRLELLSFRASACGEETQAHHREGEGP